MCGAKISNGLNYLLKLVIRTILTKEKKYNNWGGGGSNGITVAYFLGSNINFLKAKLV
jgi:hypothetical protein